jgi:hypothetical protein
MTYEVIVVEIQIFLISSGCGLAFGKIDVYCRYKLWYIISIVLEYSPFYVKLCTRRMFFDKNLGVDM